MSRGWWILILLASAFTVGLLSGCSSKPIIETQVIEKPVPVYCTIPVPAECKDSYAVDRVSPKDEPLTINRAMRIEIEERWACQIKLKAALNGCNSTPRGN
jgi:hypothetical protein